MCESNCVCVHKCVCETEREREKKTEENIPGNYQNYVL